MEDIDFRKLVEFDNHKLVTRFEDKESGLKGFIAIHNDNLGLPAVGGTRMFPYASEKEALADVLKLSRAMTYKCAIAKVPHGGAKGVIIGDPKKDKTEKLLKAYAKEANKLEGKFSTGEDVGISQEDVNVMLQVSNYFIGKPNLAGDPSPYAALSVFYSIESAVKYLCKLKPLKDLKVAVKGVGKTGSALVGHLIEWGVAEIFVADIDPVAIDKIVKKFPQVKVVDTKEIRALTVDVFAPCAMGDEFSMNNVSEIKARIICGSANNQLTDDKVGDWLFRHEIYYVPDYVANSGGLINVVDELARGGYKKTRVLKRIDKVKDTVRKILELSIKENKSPHRISDKIAESYFKK